MYSQFYPADLDKWKIWQVQTDSKPTEDYVSMDDDLDDALIEGVQELAVEKPPPVADASVQTEFSNDQGEWLKLGNMSWKMPSLADEVGEDVAVEDERVDVVVEDATEESPSVADATMRAETDEERLQALKVWANEQGGANLPHIPSSGEYFYLY